MHAAVNTRFVSAMGGGNVANKVPMLLWKLLALQELRSKRVHVLHSYSYSSGSGQMLSVNVMHYMKSLHEIKNSINTLLL